MLADIRSSSGHDLIGRPETEYRRPVDIIPFAAWHLGAIEIRPEQWAYLPQLSPEYGRALEEAGGGFTAFAGPEVIAAAGIVKLWEGRAQVWALMTPGMPERGLIISRAVKRYLQQYRVARLECVIDPQFSSSVTWAKWLGFRFESRMQHYKDGRSMDMYVRLEE